MFCSSEADSAEEFRDESRWANFSIGRELFPCSFISYVHMILKLKTVK
jgi:hypothetical protein